jgi:hypothetical protein
MWILRHADGGVDGTTFARARTAGDVDSVLVHAAPDRMRVEVFDGDHRFIAGSDDLPADGASPMSRLTISSGTVVREMVWPDVSDEGAIVVLPGGEAGTLVTWRTDEDRTSWVWTVTFSGGR